MRSRIALSVLLLTSVAAVASAQSPALRVDRDGRPSVTLSLDAIRQLPSDTVSSHGSHGAAKVRYRAVKLTDVLAAAGSPVDSLRLGYAVWLIVATSRDGYLAAFTSGEIEPTLGPSRVYLAFSRDGAPLADNEAPFELIVPTDAKATRSARMVTRLRIFDPLAHATP